MTAGKPRVVNLDRLLSVQLCPPAVRMVVINAWAWAEDGKVLGASQVLPVLALQAAVTRRFRKLTHEERYPDTSGTERELIEKGWNLDEQDARVSALICDKEYGLIAHDDLLFESDNSLMRLVCTPWPPEEDEKRLAPIRGEVEQEIVERESKRCKQEARKAKEPA